MKGAASYSAGWKRQLQWPARPTPLRKACWDVEGLRFLPWTPASAYLTWVCMSFIQRRKMVIREEFWTLVRNAFGVPCKCEWTWASGDSDNSFSGCSRNELSKTEDLLQDHELPLRGLSVECLLHLMSIPQWCGWLPDEFPTAAKLGILQTFPLQEMGRPCWLQNQAKLSCLALESFHVYNPVGCKREWMPVSSLFEISNWIKYECQYIQQMKEICIGLDFKFKFIMLFQAQAMRIDTAVLWGLWGRSMLAANLLFVFGSVMRKFWRSSMWS